MKEKVVKIQFDYDSYVKSMTVAWDYSIKNIVRNYLIHSGVAISLMVLGGIIESRDLRPLLIIFGFCYFVYMIINWANFYKSKREYFRKILNIAHQYEAKKAQCIYSFNENTLEYKDEKQSSSLNWEFFESYMIFKDTIMIFLKADGNLYTSINNAMIDVDDFNDIKSFLKDKLPLKS
jgi:hypothetical protein